MAPSETTASRLPLDQMSTSDKIRAMEALWDDLCRRAEGISSPDWHDEVLNKREESISSAESCFVDWELAKARIRDAVS